MKNKEVTIKDVARESGVSIATVSQILNGNDDKFSAKTVEKVLKVKHELNYEADYFARRMIIKKSKTIGILVPDITNPFFSTLIRGIENVLYRENFVAILCNVDSDEQKQTRYLEELSHRGVDGYIIASSEISNQEINETLKKRQQPFIVLDQKKADGFSDAVLTDDISGGKQAGEHFLSLRHRHTVIVAPKDAPENIENRIKGFKIHYPDAAVIYTELSKIGGRDAAKKIVDQNATAIFAVNDELAFGLYLGMAELGKKIPEDYSIIGYDNIDMCEYVTPQLTTIAQPILKLGETAAELLLKRSQFPEKEWEEIVLPVQLLKRFSTAHLQ